MPDADDFDVEELRALLRGDSPQKAREPAPRAKSTPAKRPEAPRTPAKPAAPVKKRGRR